MGRYFGTDGIRGVANRELTVPLAFRVGCAAACALCSETAHKPRILIGKDTRISSDMLEAALVSGATAAGADVELLGVIPTPAVAYHTVKSGADMGIVISASHNPYEYNGIKMFSAEGYKLNDALEARIEELIDHSDEIGLKTGGEIGRVRQMQALACEEYAAHLRALIEGDYQGLRIALDCANGASSGVIAKVLEGSGAVFDIAFNEPDGVNINAGCGSTHLAALSRRVVEGGYDVGIAFDGDADRCLAVDETGKLIDGDHIMAICASYLKRENRLKNDTFVATVMSNLGLHFFGREQGLDILAADVGDRCVLEKMQQGGHVLGGEQSGHVIFLEYATTGDGELTAVQFLNILKKSGKKASELNAMVREFPQILINVKVPLERKATIAQEAPVKAAIAAEEAAFGEEGRVLVRPSGTEALVRVMVEGKTDALVRGAAERIVKVIEETLK